MLGTVLGARDPGVSEIDLEERIDKGRDGLGNGERTIRPLTDKETELQLEGMVSVGIQPPNGLARAVLESSTVPSRSASSMAVQLPGRILGMSLHPWAWAAFVFF